MSKSIKKQLKQKQTFLKQNQTFQQNVVIYCLTESTDVSDADQVKEVQLEMKCEDTIPEKHVRLGKSLV